MSVWFEDFSSLEFSLIWKCQLSTVRLCKCVQCKTCNTSRYARSSFPTYITLNPTVPENQPNSRHATLRETGFEMTIISSKMRCFPSICAHTDPANSLVHFSSAPREIKHNARVYILMFVLMALRVRGISMFGTRYATTADVTRFWCATAVVRDPCAIRAKRQFRQIAAIKITIITSGVLSLSLSCWMRVCACVFGWEMMILSSFLSLSHNGPGSIAGVSQCRRGIIVSKAARAWLNSIYAGTTESLPWRCTLNVCLWFYLDAFVP